MLATDLAAIMDKLDRFMRDNLEELKGREEEGRNICWAQWHLNQAFRELASDLQDPDPTDH